MSQEWPVLGATVLYLLGDIEVRVDRRPEEAKEHYPTRAFWICMRPVVHYYLSPGRTDRLDVTRWGPELACPPPTLLAGSKVPA
jgi:hypothetical protein